MSKNSSVKLLPPPEEMARRRNRQFFEEVCQLRELLTCGTLNGKQLSFVDQQREVEKEHAHIAKSYCDLTENAIAEIPSEMLNQLLPLENVEQIVLMARELSQP